MKHVTQSEAAKADVRAAAAYYEREAGTTTALDFADAVQTAIRQASTWPGSGSTRFAEMLHIPGLRSLALPRFPYIVFYIEYPESIDVWRILHDRRDIPDALRADP